MAMQKILVQETKEKMMNLGTSINWGYLADENGLILCHKYDWHRQAVYVRGNFLNKEIMVDVSGYGLPDFLGEYKLPKDQRLALLNKYGFFKRNRMYKSRNASDEECFQYFNEGEYHYTRWLCNAVSWWYNPEGKSEEDWRSNGLSVIQIERNSIPKVGLVQGRDIFGQWVSKFYMASDASIEEVKEALSKL